tara:strand:+ start:9616 stop:10608 length:993 start_codon:yes stop_codon:yes gene_type:complete
MGADIQPGMMNKDSFQIFITHIPTNNTVNFNAWVTGFSDSFNSSWSGTPVYGRMDELYTFERTTRKISIAFDVVASNKFEAAKNMRKLNELTQFLYPVYSVPHGDLGTNANSQTLKAAPLLKMKWNGLISNALNGADLVGFLNGFTYDPDLSQGQFFVKGRNSGQPYIAYQTHKVQLEYTVLHTHLTGWAPRSIDVGGGHSKYIFGGDERRELGSTFPHAISDPVLIPDPENSNDARGPAPGLPNPSATAGEVAAGATGLPGDGSDGTTPIEIEGAATVSALGGGDAVIVDRDYLASVDSGTKTTQTFSSTAAGLNYDPNYAGNANSSAV